MRSRWDLAGGHLLKSTHPVQCFPEGMTAAPWQQKNNRTARLVWTPARIVLSLRRCLLQSPSQLIGRADESAMTAVKLNLFHVLAKPCNPSVLVHW